MKNNINDIYYIINNIKNIEAQIDFFNKKKFSIFRRQKSNKHKEIIEKLENVKKDLYIKLEKIIDNKL